ncbi:DUF6234 family protein [Streptomyces sp. NPDC127033]|uniref:DUF6234 family protein n=1 Tax=Streptomyces sp. NPDC127033 TaxID=3347110 RepID=UPI00365E61AB
MTFPPGSRAPLPPETSGGGGAGGGGCVAALVLILEIPVALVTGVQLGLREWARSGAVGERAGAVPEVPPMDWVPTLWCGAFTLGALTVAVVFLRSAHPYAGGIQLCIAAFALFVTLGVWSDANDRAHPAPPPPCPTRAGVPCAENTENTEGTEDPGRSGHQCRSGGDSHECADSGG